MAGLATVAEVTFGGPFWPLLAVEAVLLVRLARSMPSRTGRPTATGDDGPRVVALLPIVIDGAPGRLVDLGDRGVGVETTRDLRPGDATTLTIFRYHHEPLAVRVAVVHASPNDMGVSLGLRLLDPACSAAFGAFARLWTGVADEAAVRTTRVRKADPVEMAPPYAAHPLATAA